MLQSPGNGAGKARVGRCWEAAPPACPAVLPLHPGLTSTQPQRNPALGGQGGPQIFLWGSPWRNQCAGQIRLPKGSKGFPGEKKKRKEKQQRRGRKGSWEKEAQGGVPGPPPRELWALGRLSWTSGPWQTRSWPLLACSPLQSQCQAPSRASRQLFLGPGWPGFWAVLSSGSGVC